MSEPNIVGNMFSVIADTTQDSTGVGWRLSESARQLDANLVHLGRHKQVELHVEADLDVFIVVVSGSGTLFTEAETLALQAGSLVWLPHGHARGLAAGEAGLDYLTVHQRRPGMWIGTRAR